MLQFYKDRLCVRVYRDRLQMGKAAAEDIAQAILALCEKKDRINMIFAAAPSQNEVLRALREDARIPWQKIRAFHMDEYIGLRADAPQGFGNFLRKNLFGQVPFYKVHYIDCTASDPQKECERYAELLRQYPPDISYSESVKTGILRSTIPPWRIFEIRKRLRSYNSTKYVACNKSTTVVLPRLAKYRIVPSR